MSLIPALDAPTLPVRPWWMTAVVTGQSSNARMPLSHIASVPRGEILVSLASFLADTGATSDADPGAGNLRWNHATQASATELYVSDTDGDAGDLSAKWGSIGSGANLYLTQADDLDVYQWWEITSTTDATGYVKLALNHVASAGSFGDDDPVVLTIQNPQESTDGGLNITDEATTARTMTAADHGRDKLTRFTNSSASTADFDSAEGYTRGMIFAVRAAGAGGLTLVGDGVTITPTADGTLVLAQGMSASVVMLSATTAEVHGQTVPA